ncbi:MAG: hypothetical protein IPL53_18375 [Ignavibacteria bacterium]|nr:hypothetical protein [Ignavibacteria bacterium]
MENSKIIKLLKSLNQYEFRQFRDYVYSPAFNKKEIVTRLFDELRKHYPRFESDELSNEILFHKILPGEKYNYFKLKNAISDLFILGKDFLSFLGFKKKERLKEILLLAELRVRKLDSLFEQTHKAAAQKIESSKVKDDEYVYHMLELAVEKIGYLTVQAPNKHVNIQQEMFDLFLTYSIIRILKSYTVMMHEEKQNNYKYDKYLFDEIMSFAEKKKFDNPTLNVYYHTISLERDRNDVNFYKLKEARAKYLDELNEYDEYMVFLHLNGYCTNEFNINCRTDLMREHFDLIKNKNTKVYTTIGKLIYLDFINEVKIALRVDEIDWVEKYIEKNKSNLTGEEEGSLNFCNGLLNLKRGNHDKALELLAKTNFPNFIIKLQVKILQLQIFYEKGYYDQAISAIDTFRHYLKRETTIKENFKKTFYEFVNILNNLIKLKTGSSGNDTGYELYKIKEDIELMTSNQFGVKLWLKQLTVDS